MITIRDVARSAGVSVATVSRVFNDSGPVHEATRRRIRAVAKRLRYTPNSAARSLSTNRTRTIGVLLPDLYGEFFSEVIRGIDQTAQGNGYHLVVSSSHNHRADIAAAMAAMHGRVDGLLLMSPGIDARTLSANLAKTLPVVLLNCAVKGSTYDSLNIANREGAYDLVRHLVKGGHRRIAIVQGAAGNVDARDRLRGYRDALRDAGIPRTPQWELAGDFTEVSGFAAARALLTLPAASRPTALFAANDSMAIGALSALRENGIAVPGEMAVAGFDDIPIARYMNPALTSVHVEISELGARAVRMLVHAITHKNRHERHRETVPATLVVRRSCGPTELG
ncbi:MAG: LacI family DNA-binding transcriptional regulator [Gemmatimonadaceae bacterium]